MTHACVVGNLVASIREACMTFHPEQHFGVFTDLCRLHALPDLHVRVAVSTVHPQPPQSIPVFSWERDRYVAIPLTHEALMDFASSRSQGMISGYGLITAQIALENSHRLGLDSLRLEHGNHSTPLPRP